MARDVFIPASWSLLAQQVPLWRLISIYPPCSISEKVKETNRVYGEAGPRNRHLVGLFNIQFTVDASENV